MAKQYSKVAALSDTFRTEFLDAHDPRIKAAVEDYKKKWNLPDAATPAAEGWYGVFEGDTLLIAVGEKRQDTACEVTDMYPVPGTEKRKVVAAIYAMLNVYSTALRRKLFTSLVCTVLFRNKAFQKAVERVFNVTPTAVVYIAEAA
jgi:hypothetical protein